MILLDTHAALWFAMADEALGRRSQVLARRALAEDNLFVAAVSAWEIALLIDRKRIDVATDARGVRERMLQGGIQELPLTGDVALLATELGLHGDPADRFIAATAVTHSATLLTADRKLLQWRHPLKRQDARK